MNLLTQAVISGLMTGAVYSLMGIGLVIVYRTSRILNLAHGESFAVAGVTAALGTAHGLPLWLAMLLAVCASILLSLILYRIVLRPRAHWPMAALVLATLAAAFFMRGLMMVVVGPDPVSFPGLFSGPPLRIAGGVLPVQGLTLILLGFIASALVAALLWFTFLGKQLLATAENPLAAQLLGINVERARMIAFGISGGLAGISALLLVPLISVDYQSGLPMTMRGFIAAAISGMSPVVAIVAGFLLGLFEAGVGAYFGALYQDPVMFGILIMVALWQSRAIRFGGARRA
jgi:branched-subunit amino acid ABC-type transport system permease component